MQNILRPWILLALLMMILGCESTDHRLMTISQQHAAQQAQQNQKMAELQQEVAEGSKRLVEADAQARQEFVAIQHELRQEQARVGQQRDVLESERKDLAAARQRDPIVAAAILDTGLVLACLLPLAVAVYALWATRHTGETDQAVMELLVEEIVADQPRLLLRPATPGLAEHSCQPLLPHERNERENTP